MKSKEKEDTLTLEGHLTELRSRLIRCVLAFLIATIISYNYAERIAQDIVNRAPDMNFIYISPSELMMSYIRIALICGAVLASPIIVSQIWLYIRPGLTNKESFYTKVSFVLGAGFFIIGVLFSYEMVLPLIFKFFAGFQTEDIQANISFASYLSFVTRIVLSFGLVFELPILMFILARFGLVTTEFFIKNRKYMVLIIFVVAAILTPPDVVSQTMLALPMIVLYQIGILLSRFGKNQRAEKLDLNENEDEYGEEENHKIDNEDANKEEIDNN